MAAITEGPSAITTRTDLLARAISYTDTWSKTSTSTYHQAGRRTATNGPAGLNETTYDPAGRVVAQKLDGAVMATVTYHASTGEPASASCAAALNGATARRCRPLPATPAG